MTTGNSLVSSAAWLLTACCHFVLHFVSHSACLAAGPQTGTPTNRLLVVAPRAFHPSLERFVAHKRTLLKTDLLALETILTEGQGVDDAEKLKRFFYREWKGVGLGYVLLVGDVDVMPVRYMVLDRVTPAAYDYAFYPSDLYYSDLAKPDGTFDDWNAARDSFHSNYFGEVRGEKNKSDPINYDQVDYRPEIAVGRWPVSTAAEVPGIAAKTVAYELEVLRGGQSPRTLFVASGGWVDSRNLMDKLAARLAPVWQIEKRYYSDARRSSSTIPPSNEELRSLLNRGAGLVVHAGHGQPGEWEGCLSVHDLRSITNSAALPVMISAGCSTAYFAPLAPYDGYVDVDGLEHAGTDDKEVFAAPPPPPANYQIGKFNPGGLGEVVLKQYGSGGVAYIGCNTGSQPCGLTLVDGFVTALADSPNPRLGDCWVRAVSMYYEKERLGSLKPDAGWYPPSIFFQGMKFMVFGDPSLRLPGRNGGP